MRNIEILAEIALIFTNSEPFSQQINKTMEIIGRYLSLSRVYIFLDTIDGKMTNNVFEWCNENINQQINNLQNISYTDVPSWKLFLNRGAIIVDAISDLPIDLHEILKSQDIISLLVYPLIIKGEIKGFVGFDECLKPRKWQHSELYIAKTFAGLVSGSYERSLIYEQLNIKKNMINLNLLMTILVIKRVILLLRSFLKLLVTICALLIFSVELAVKSLSWWQLTLAKIPRRSLLREF